MLVNQGRVRHAVHTVADRVMRRGPIDPIKHWLWLVPPLLGFRRELPRYGWWPDFTRPVPGELRTTPGIEQRPEDVRRAAKERPPRDWRFLHPDTVQAIYRLGWAYHLPTAPRRLRLERRIQRQPRGPNAGRGPDPREDPAELTRALRERAASLGLSTLGIAEYDPSYTYVEHEEKQVGSRVVVCALEANWEATQTIPSVRSEKSILTCTLELARIVAELQGFLVERGYRARLNSNEIVLLPYAVQAGLGQLGLNGQVLTPKAGSRARMASLGTDAPLLLDRPRDFGITKICDACQICVRRCPPGAITMRREFHRGVEKAKINGARCAPVVAKAHHCAVCMKVCPVQRYGLERVLDHYEATGEILGKGTPELESYEFEGRLYGPGERPALRQSWLDEVPFSEDESASAVQVDPERDLLSM